jgi:hypothetical protein
MNRKFYLAALASGACVALTFAFVACQSSDDAVTATGGSNQGGAAGTNHGGSAGTSVGGGAQGGSAGTSVGGGGQGGSAGTSVGGGGQGGSAGGTCMAGQAQTVEGIATSAVGPGIAVQFTGIATTPPILVYTSKTKGTCLWAVFVKDTAKDYATMVVSYGANMTTLADGGLSDCVPNTLFDGIVAGDTLTITGETDAYVPSTCADAGVTVAKQIQVKIDEAATACLTKVSGTAPAAVKVTDIDGLAQGAAAFQSMLVELDNVTAEDWSDGGPVGAYGVLKIKGTNETLEIHDKFYYTSEGAPKYASGTTFTKITGLLYLDYCTWAIEPLHKCTDLVPASTDCP